MTTVRFRPWVGMNYAGGFKGLRTLVLGESHYESRNNPDISNSPNETIGSIQEQVDGWTYAFWTKLTAAMIGRTPTLEDKGEFWHSVAYYNYVQESAGFGPRIMPAQQSWEMSKFPFQEVLHELRPEFVVALGHRLWERLPDLNRCEGPKIGSVPESRTWIYPHSEGSALLCNIRHPSSAFSPPEWHEYISAAHRKAQEFHRKSNA